MANRLFVCSTGCNSLLYCNRSLFFENGNFCKQEYFLNKVYREEKKFLINIEDFLKTSHDLDGLLMQDDHNGTFGYIVKENKIRVTMRSAKNFTVLFMTIVRSLLTSFTAREKFRKNRSTGSLTVRIPKTFLRGRSDISSERIGME